MELSNCITEELVSIITPVYNCERYIAQTIESVLAQTYRNWEMILIDDCSPDDSALVIASYQKTDERIKYVKLDKNGGAAAARNVGLGMAQGEYVALLDSDDYWKPAFLEKMLLRAKDTAADIVYCSYEIVDDNGGKLCNDFLVPEETDYRGSLAKCFITGSTMMLSASIVKSARFSVDVYHEDIAFWLQALRNGARSFGVVDVLACYRQRSDSKTANKLKCARERWRVYRGCLGLSLPDSVSLMLRYAYYGVLKYRKV